MMEWFQIISYLLTNELRLILGLYLISRLADFALDRRIWSLSVFWGCFVTILQIRSVSTLGIMAAEILIIAAITWYHLRDQLRLCLFLIFFYEVGVSLWDFLLSAGLGILFHSERYIITNEPEHLIGIWLVRVLMIGSTILLRKRQNSKTLEPIRITSIIAVLGLLSTITLSEQAVLPLADDQIGTWIILSMVLLFAILFYRVNRQREMEIEITQLRQAQAEILERDYRALSRTYTDNAKLYHDLHNHIEAIYQCLKQGDIQEALKYCEELRTPVCEISQTVWTGDKAIDYLISSKMALAEQRQIETKVNIEFPRNTNIRSVDLVTIIGNLLDNALESAGTAPEHLRFLGLTVRRINSMLIIKVENRCDKALIQEDGKLLTSKTDKMFHGWGLKSVQTAAEHYDGIIHTEYENGVFKSVVTLSFQSVKKE